MNDYIKRIIKSTFFWSFYSAVRLNCFRRRWIRNNKQCLVMPMNVFNKETVVVGKNSYGELNVVSFNDKSKLKIGDYVSMAQQVTFLLDVEHQINLVSTYPFKTKILDVGDEAFSKGDIIVDDDVWIGYGATILSGVHIGQGVVVAAGAVVSKDVPPYAIVGGVPAKVIRYRFSQEIIDELMKVDYGKLDDNLVKEHENDLYAELADVGQLEWLPKKE